MEEIKNEYGTPAIEAIKNAMSDMKDFLMEKFPTMKNTVQVSFDKGSQVILEQAAQRG